MIVDTEAADPKDPGLKCYMIERKLSRAEKERSERDAVKMNFEAKMQRKDSMFEEIDSDLEGSDPVL